MVGRFDTRLTEVKPLRPISKRFSWALIVVLCGSILLAPAKSSAIELGLTPKNVYGLWININKALLARAERDLRNPETLRQLSTLPPRQFNGMRPGDVFNKASAFWVDLSAAIDLVALPPTPSWIDAYAQLIETGTETTSGTTPSQVFLLSSKILNAMVKDYVTATGGRLPISGFYVDHALSGKVPSDVFGMVDLAQRRLDLIKTGLRAKPAGGNG